jgi:ribonuclease P protein component
MKDSESATLQFPRELRLLRPSDFSFVFEKPVRIGNRAFTLLARANSIAKPRLGLAIAKKQVKRAVDRNLIKRKIRETFRLHQHQLPHFDFVVMVRRDIAQMDRKEIDSAVNHLWRKAIKVCKNC